MNLYVHSPFCRRKCRYCALPSRPGVPAADRDAYARRLAAFLSALPDDLEFPSLFPDLHVPPTTTSEPLPPSHASTNLHVKPPLSTSLHFYTAKKPSPCSPDLPVDLTCSSFSTIYFGGGSPALCDLRPLFAALAPRLTPETEFTVELHPLDVTDDLLSVLRDGGVNRISMGVQSLDDATLAAMGRGYTAAEAARAFARVRRFFDNAGVDLIVGYPGDPCADYAPLADWGLTHCSAYSLQNERGLKDVPDDDWTLDRLRETAAFLESIGLERYEISNYAAPGRECRHNLAVWRGEDYLGLGEGAAGRLGRFRTRNLGACPHVGGACPQERFLTGGTGSVPSAVEEVTPEEDALERRIFRLRTREGLDARGRPDWAAALAAHVEAGLLTEAGGVYRLTARGAEVCDSILADLV